MKIRIVSAPKGSWYETLVGRELEIEYTDETWGGTDYTLKDWNWYWKRENLITVSVLDAEIIDHSGSDFEDGLQMGMAYGRLEKVKELIAEGILDEDYEDQPDE